MPAGVLQKTPRRGRQRSPTCPSILPLLLWNWAVQKFLSNSQKVPQKHTTDTHSQWVHSEHGRPPVLDSPARVAPQLPRRAATKAIPERLRVSQSHTSRIQKNSRSQDAAPFHSWENRGSGKTQRFAQKLVCACSQPRGSNSRQGERARTSANG